MDNIFMHHVFIVLENLLRNSATFAVIEIVELEIVFYVSLLCHYVAICRILFK